MDTTNMAHHLSDTAHCLFAVLFLTLKPPEYDGPADVVHLNPESLKRKVIDGEGDEDAWLVYCYADWCDNCNYFQPMFADLSMRLVVVVVLSISLFLVPLYAHLISLHTVASGTAPTN